MADALNLNAGVALAAATVAADAKEGVAMAQEAQRRWAAVHHCNPFQSLGVRLYCGLLHWRPLPCPLLQGA